ncbi:MAG: HAMP domain-containing sensor histidine kinase [Aestuariivirga sp.]
MNSGSLRLRLLVASAVSIFLALFLAGFALVKLFEAQVVARVERELTNHLLQLAGALETGADGKLFLARQLADPRFQQPLSGLYWQIDWKEQQPLRSRSLWDEGLQMPPLDAAVPNRIVQIPGPDATPLLALERTVIILKGAKPYEVRLLVGTDASEVSAPVASFMRWLILSLAALAVFLAMAAWAQVKVGLRPLETLRAGLGQIRLGELTRLSGNYPSEIAPLVSEFNGVLDVQERSLARARARAADLAHGLKTPLTVLSAVARDLRSKGRSKAAGDIAEQAETMHVVIERELSRSRLSQGRGAAKVVLAPEVERLVASVRRLPQGEKLKWEVSVPAGISVPIEKVDLVELLGNILDNARKWARREVRVSADKSEGVLALIVEDDGPGVDVANISRVMERGFSLDTNARGSGLGLAIVKDIAELYGLQVGLAISELGGLSVKIRFPARSA